MRLINADALIQILEDYAKDDWSNTTMTTWAHAYVEAAEIVDEQPTIEERKKGKWVENSPVSMKCNQCDFVIHDWHWHAFNFCPNCGADMRGEEDDRT